MKRVLVLVVAIFAMNVSRAQTDSAYVEAGINAMRLLTFGNAPQVNPNSDVWNPYLFTLEGGIKNFGLRFGFARSKHEETVLPVDINGNNRIDTDTSSSNIRIGLFYSYNPDHRWSFKIGVDYYSFKTNYTSTSEFIAVATQEEVIQETTREYRETGFSPFINAQYHVTPRVSIGTELLFRNGNYAYDILGTDTSNPLVVTRKYEGKKSYFILPTALFLTFRF